MTRRTVEVPLSTSLTTAFKAARPGDDLVLRGGTRKAKVRLSSTDTPKGTALDPITVSPYPGEKVLLQGELKLSGADYWDIAGLNVQWVTGNTSSHLVQMYGGKNWSFHDAEIWDARCFSALNVDNAASDFRIHHLNVHDTWPTNALNQDHLIYVATNCLRGTVDRNLLRNALNGRGVKVGPGSLTDPGSDLLAIEYNTIINTRGPSCVQFSGDSSGSAVSRNVLVSPKVGGPCVSYYELTGTGNVARDNVWWDAGSAVQSGDSGLIAGTGNVKADPKFDAAYKPTNPAALGYGHLA